MCRFGFCKRSFTSEIRTFRLIEGKWKFYLKDIRIVRYKQLKEFGNEEAPLGVCADHWGTQLILAKFWSNKKGVEDDETDSSSSEDSSFSYDIEEKGNGVDEIEGSNNENESSSRSEKSGDEITMDVLSSLRRLVMIGTMMIRIVSNKNDLTI
ncbi:hypothetical protein G6F56_001256 [Rhizopus delemar]|nr:hypothetical protein G6F56_001256 [Rhizopus delemar]